MSGGIGGLGGLVCRQAGGCGAEAGQAPPRLCEEAAPWGLRLSLAALVRRRRRECACAHDELFRWAVTALI